MKVWKNLKIYEEGILINMGVSKEDKLYFHDALAQALQDLIDMRKNREMTERYFRTALTTDERRNEHARVVNEMGKDARPYQGYPKEWRLSDAIGHNALWDIIKDDRYSFGYLVRLLAPEVLNHEIVGTSDDAIKYAVDFDIDDVRENLNKLKSREEKINYLIECQTESKLVLPRSQDSILRNLKEDYEYSINLLMDAEKQKLDIPIEKRGGGG